MDTGSLRAAIENLYRVFSRYPFRHPVEGCSHCVTLADQQRLGAAPLQQVRADDLFLFSMKALTTCARHLTAFINNEADELVRQ
jgi:hypothetical protein